MEAEIELQPRYEVLEHTADVGLRAFGETLEETFSFMAVGMLNLILSSDSHVSCAKERHVEVNGYDLEGLMVAWLSEILFLDLFRRFCRQLFMT